MKYLPILIKALPPQHFRPRYLDNVGSVRSSFANVVPVDACSDYLDRFGPKLHKDQGIPADNLKLLQAYSYNKLDKSQKSDWILVGEESVPYVVSKYPQLLKASQFAKCEKRIRSFKHQLREAISLAGINNLNDLCGIDQDSVRILHGIFANLLDVYEDHESLTSAYEMIGSAKFLGVDLLLEVSDQ